MRTPLPTVVAAPMAGGPSTPALVAAVTRAGGFGFLAGGLKTPDVLAAEIAELKAELGPDQGFGVNLFVPNHEPPVNLEPYRDELAETAARFGVEVGQPNWDVDDDYPAKVELLASEGIEVVSFTFGMPAREVIERLTTAGSTVWATVTSPAEAIASWSQGVDGLVVQGPCAGGHRGTQRPGVNPDQTPLPQLVASITELVPLPLFAAGGNRGREDITELLRAGAQGVQIGTLLLRTPESGAQQVHKDALAWERETLVTRCFSGRWARAIRNEFTDAHHAQAPGAYPQVAQLTASIRAAAQHAQDPEHQQLWAGTGHLQARAVPAAEVIADLLP